MTSLKEVIQSELKQSEAKAAVKQEATIDAQGRAFAVGKRKNAIARVWIKKGTGNIKINSRNAREYLGREILFNIAISPLAATNNSTKFDIVADIVGGGLSGQAGALKHGISKALVNFQPEMRIALREKGDFLTRDSRVVESKKYGYKKARKGKTYRKR